jgi:predicted nucleic acid-binding protein
MKDRFFLDTNILVYAFEPRDSNKQAKAKELIGEAFSTRRGMISHQVAQEFLNVATRKWENQLSVSDCLIFTEQVLQPLCAVSSSIELLRDALRLHDETGYDFYDSMIVAAAMESQCGILYSEDFQSGQNIKNLRIINPFLPAPR